MICYSGLVTAIEMFDGSVWGVLVGLFVLAIALGLVTAAAMDLLLLSKVIS
jgi:uncharacterized membrane protein